VSAEKPTVSPGILQVGGISLRDLFAVAAIASGSSSRDAYLAADQAMALREATAPADSSRGETCNDVFAGLVCEEPRGHVGQHREGLNVWSEERKAAFAAKFGAEFTVPADDAPGAPVVTPADLVPVRSAMEAAEGFLGELGGGPINSESAEEARALESFRRAKRMVGADRATLNDGDELGRGAVTGGDRSNNE
jgi:hypothetical protein